MTATKKDDASLKYHKLALVIGEAIVDIGVPMLMITFNIQLSSDCLGTALGILYGERRS